MQTMAEALYPGGPSMAQGNAPAYRTMENEEWKGVFNKMKRGDIPTYGKNYQDLEGALRNNPDGFIVEGGHPGISGLSGKADIATSPSGMFFVKPKNGGQ